MISKPVRIGIISLVAVSALVIGYKNRSLRGAQEQQAIAVPETPYGIPASRENNSNYPMPNPFYFEGKIDYELLGIDTPQNAWEFAQRGIHKQDDLEDFEGAVTDYRQSISMNNLQNGTCQLVTVSPVPPTLNPPPCMFTVRSRLAYLLMEEDHPEEAIALFQEVLQIDPLRLDVNALIGEAYMKEAEETSATNKPALLAKAVDAFKAELALSPVTSSTAELTGDEANNSQVHWALAEVYEELNRPADAVSELNLYLKATKWHSDTYPWRIELAKHKIEELGHIQ